MVNKIATNSNKASIIESLLHEQGFTYETFRGQYRGYSGWVNKDRTIIRLVQFQKLNKKSHQCYHTVDGRNITTSLVLRHSGWIVTYSDIELSKVKSAFQFARDFSLELV